MRLAIVLSALLATTSSAQPELVIVREGGKQYHRPGCPLIRDGKGVLALSRGEAEARQLKPHPECDPSDPRNTIDAARPTAPVYVYTDRSKYYHREKCAKLGADAKRVTVEEAAKKLWPCGVCKPPKRPRPAGK
jgi:hypothetical protein